MKRFETHKAYLVCMVLVAVFISCLAGCGGGGGGIWGKPVAPPVITSYSFVEYPAAPGTVNELAKTIAVTLPFGTDVRALTARFTTTGTIVRIGSTIQTSGTTQNSFTTPKVYTVTSADGRITSLPYTVTVTIAPSSLKTITAYSFVEFPAAPGTVNELAKTIAVTLPFGTNVTALTAKYTTTGTSVGIGATTQTSGTTHNDFTTPKAYTVTAADGTTTAVPYTVTVSIAPSPLKTITAFSFVGFTGFPGTINETAKTIAVTLPFGTPVTALTAKFTTTGTVVKIGSVIQTSEAPPTNDFTTPQAYTVTAADGTTTAVPYTVTVTIAPSPLKTITAFSFVGFTGFPGTINELAKTIAVTLPFGTPVTALTAKFTTTGTVVKIGSVIQTSEAPPTNDFTTPKAYAVTAADGTTTAVPYTVTVSIAPSPLKTITAFSFVGFTGFPGTINELAKTIAVTLPFGTDVTALTAKFSTTGTIVKIGSVIQTSEAPPTNNFTTPKAYAVTAADGTTTAVPYTVTVTIAPSPLKTITAFSFVGFSGFPGTINELAKTIAVALPFGTDVTALTAKFTTTGTVVKIGSVIQTSEAPPTNDFTTPKAYAVTAADGTTTAVPYTVTVTIAPSPLKTITAFSFVGFTGFPGTINELAKTIAVALPFGTDVTALTAKFTTTGTVVKIGSVIQTSEAPPTNDFTTPKAYAVTAADGTTTAVPYTVTVTIAPSPLKTITAFSFVGFTGFPGTINEASKTIAVTLPFGTPVTALTAKFTTTGTVVKIGSVIQTSEAPPTNDFTTPKAYAVTAADGTTTAVPYTVTVSIAPSPLKTITAFSFVGFSGFPGTINELAKTIAVTLPFGTPVTALTAKFTTTGTVVKIGSVIQTSEAPPTNDFTTPKAYAVTAADGTTTAVPYTVTVTLAPSSLKTITAFEFVGFSGFPGTVNEAAKTIAVNLPFGTDVSALTAKFTTTGMNVRIGTVIQTSEAPPTNAFTTPQTYRVTAADGTFQDYVVTVKLNVPNLGAIAPFGGFGGGAGMTNQGIFTVINNGDVGTTGVSTMMTGFHDSTGDIYTETPLNIGNVKGRIYTDAPPPVIFAAGGPYGGNATTKAIADAAALAALKAYNDLAGLPGGAFAGAGELGGLTLASGTYTSASSFKITNGDLTLNGTVDDVWIFQMGTSLTVGSPGLPRNVILTGGAKAKNVFWQVGSAARIEDRCSMVGTIIASAGVTISTAGQTVLTTLDGRAIGLNASVTLVNTVINVPAP